MYSQVMRVEQSINVTNHLCPPREGVELGPQTSEWITSNWCSLRRPILLYVERVCLLNSQTSHTSLFQSTLSNKKVPSSSDFQKVRVLICNAEARCPPRVVSQ